MTLDPANSGDPETPPLNESLNKPPCKLPVFTQLVKSVKRGIGHDCGESRQHGHHLAWVRRGAPRLG